MLVTSIFSFSNNVFYPTCTKERIAPNEPHYSCRRQMLSSFDKFKILSPGKKLKRKKKEAVACHIIIYRICHELTVEIEFY